MLTNKASYEEYFDKFSIVNNPGSFNAKQYEKYVLNVYHQPSTTPEDDNWVLLGFLDVECGHVIAWRFIMSKIGYLGRAFG